jgi:hypothetical protein
MLTTTTVTVRRHTATVTVGQGGMVDPWDTGDTDVHEPGSVREWALPASIVKPGVGSSRNGGVRQETEWRMLCAADADVAIGDTITDADGVSWTVTAMVRRPGPEGGSLAHTAVDLQRVDGQSVGG